MQKKMAGIGILFFAFIVGSGHDHSVKDLTVRSYGFVAESTLGLQFQSAQLGGGGATPSGSGNSPPGGVNSGGNIPPGGANSVGNTPPGGANTPPGGGYTSPAGSSTPLSGGTTPLGSGNTPGGAAASPPHEQRPVQQPVPSR
jgi:hypothetical protein